MPFHISQKAKLHFYHLQALEPINTYQAAPNQHFLSLKGMSLEAHLHNGLPLPEQNILKEYSNYSNPHKQPRE